MRVRQIRAQGHFYQSEQWEEKKTNERSEYTGDGPCVNKFQCELS